MDASETKNLTFTPAVLVAFLRYVPGFMTLWAAVASFINLSLGHHLALRAPGRSTITVAPLTSLNLPFWLWGFFAVCGVIGMLFSDFLLGLIAVNVILVLMAVFLVEGLSVLKCVLARHKNGKVLFLVGAGVVFVFNFLVLGIVIVGILEPWLKLRRKAFDHRSDQ